MLKVVSLSDLFRLRAAFFVAESQEISENDIRATKAILIFMLTCPISKCKDVINSSQK